MTRAINSKKSTTKVKRKQSLEVVKQKLYYALPALVMLVLAVTVYWLALVPSRPENVLSRAISNTLDADKQRSGRYDGTFGIDEWRLGAEYNGQFASNGDSSFYLKLNHRDQPLTFEQIAKGVNRYVRIDGTEIIPGLFKDIPGALPLSQDITVFLSVVDGQWLQINPIENFALNQNLSCVGLASNITDIDGYDSISLPLVIKEGPYRAQSGSNDQVFKVSIDSAKASDSEIYNAILALLNCIDSLRQDDFRLRQANDTDIEVLQFEITTDPLSNTVRRVVSRQFGNYFQLNLRDFNKDVVVRAPEVSQLLTDVLDSLQPKNRQEIINRFGLEATPALQ